MYASSRVGLREKPAHEPDEVADRVLGDETGALEVKEEEPRQHRRHLAATHHTLTRPMTRP